ncbi:MAG: TonB-dependent receptor [Bacteroidales bacterium]|jgi:hypothetical protein|nr:TonB-dependent receptor [Bacteroidales bacterium]
MAGTARTLLIFFLLFGSVHGYGQAGKTVIKGYVRDSAGKALALVNIGVKDMPYGTWSDADGSYSISIPADNELHILVFSIIGYLSYETQFTASPDTIEISPVLETGVTRLDDVIITEYRQREAPTLRTIPLKDISLIPAASGSIEKLLVSLPGVNSASELSNQYTVRGGSFDENLVYLNDIEIFHPVLIKTGQQEGLSILNPDLIQNVRFSAGGFNASFGDRMSSVLDITYKDPDETKGSVKAGLLHNSIHLEGTGLNDRFSFLAGARYKTNQLLIQTLDTKGNYKPAFYDIQSLLRYRISPASRLSLMGTYNFNKYSFIPASRRSTFGNINEAYQLYVRYDGSETVSYRSLNLALSLETETAGEMKHSVIAHYYRSTEEENHDIKGTYALNMLDKNLGSENFGDSIMNVGTGSWLNHARNMLNFNIITINYKGRWEYAKNILSWGLRYRHESAGDKIREWERIDSAGYSIPYSEDHLLLSNVSINDTSLSSNRFEIYFIDNYTFSISDQQFIFTGGVRFTYWSFSRETLLSPRLSLSWSPSGRNARYYISGGIYYQPPYYREMRYPSGKINMDIVSQKSIHTVIGANYDFLIGKTPFRLTGELYYKDLSNIIPYKYDNVRIIYSAENIASGFVRGVDLRINGEFVKDAESWVSLSLMDARHDILNDEYGYFPAPSDSRFSVNVFFQDYFPSNPTYRAHVSLHYSSGIPVSSPYSDRYDSYHRMPPYRRVDIGLTKVLKSTYSNVKSNSFSFFDEIIAGFEIFNLLDIRNTISYNWLTTVNNLSGESRHYAVPNYLTGRSFNFKLLVTF